MADSKNKANQRQSGKAGRKAQYANNFAKGIKNKIARLATRCKHHPNDEVAQQRYDWWKTQGYKRKGTKIAA